MTDEIKRAVFKPYNGHPQIDADLHAKAVGDYTRDLERERTQLRSVLARVHDELHDPTGQFWCDRPDEDCELIENLSLYVEQRMGWLGEEREE